MKSMLTVSQKFSGISSGCNSPIGLWHYAFVRRQRSQALQYSPTNHDMLGPPVIPRNEFKGLLTSCVACNLESWCCQQYVIADWGYLGHRSCHRNTRGCPPVSICQHEAIYHATLLSQLWAWQLHPQSHPSQIPCWILHAMSCSAPSKVTPGGHESQRIQGAEGWCCDCHRFLYHGQPVITTHRICPLCDLGDGASMKSNQTEYRDHHACHWLSIFTSHEVFEVLMGLSKSSNLCCDPSRKWCHSSKLK